MTKYTKDTLKTTEDVVKAAMTKKQEAKDVTNREQHAAWWDDKVDLLNFINDLLGTGGFEGDAYNDLMTAKWTLYRAEEMAGKAAMAHSSER